MCLSSLLYPLLVGKELLRTKNNKVTLLWKREFSHTCYYITDGEVIINRCHYVQLNKNYKRTYFKYLTEIRRNYYCHIEIKNKHLLCCIFKSKNRFTFHNYQFFKFLFKYQSLMDAYPDNICAEIHNNCCLCFSIFFIFM